MSAWMTPVLEFLLLIFVLAATVMMVALALQMCSLFASDFMEERAAKKARRLMKPKSKNTE